MFLGAFLILEFQKDVPKRSAPCQKVFEKVASEFRPKLSKFSTASPVLLAPTYHCLWDLVQCSLVETSFLVLVTASTVRTINSLVDQLPGPRHSVHGISHIL